MVVIPPRATMPSLHATAAHSPTNVDVLITVASSAATAASAATAVTSTLSVHCRAPHHSQRLRQLCHSHRCRSLTTPASHAVQVATEEITKRGGRLTVKMAVRARVVWLPSFARTVAAVWYIIGPALRPLTAPCSLLPAPPFCSLLLRPAATTPICSACWRIWRWVASHPAPTATRRRRRTWVRLAPA